MGNWGYKTPTSGVIALLKTGRRSLYGGCWGDNIRQWAKEEFPAGFNQQQPLLSIVPTQCISCNSIWIPLEVWIPSGSAILFPVTSMGLVWFTYIDPIWSHKNQLNVARYTGPMDGHVCSENLGPLTWGLLAAIGSLWVIWAMNKTLIV